MVRLSPTVKLSSGQQYPVVGLGTCESNPGEVEQAVKDAIDAGYRQFDGAFIYENEAEIGNAVRAKIVEGVIKREDVFLTSKLWNTFHRPDLVADHCKTSLENFGCEYIDLYLMYSPVAYAEGRELFPRDAAGKIITSQVDYVDTWKAMEKLVQQGLVKAIGLANFNSEQVQRILDNCTIKPVVNQVECHPYLNQKKLIQFCKARGIEVTGFSVLGYSDRLPNLLHDPKIKAMAQKYKKTPAQVIIRYLIQNGATLIPKSIKKSRIIENFQVFDFEMSAEDVAIMDTFDCNGRIDYKDDSRGHKYWPFGIPF